MSAKLIKNYSEFSEVLSIIRTGRTKADKAVNVALIDTYWAVGEHLSRKVAEAAWGKGVVKELAEWLLTRSPDLKGFSASNLWRMKQFYETYANSPKLAPLVRVLPWTHKLQNSGQGAPYRHLSPALAAQYETRMVPKEVLQQKFSERSLMLEALGVSEEVWTP